MLKNNSVEAVRSALAVVSREIRKPSSIVLPTAPPVTPAVGQIWFDVGAGKAKVWDSRTWVEL